jgi:hypothetical protein
MLTPLADSLERRQNVRTGLTSGTVHLLSLTIISIQSAPSEWQQFRNYSSSKSTKINTGTKYNASSAYGVRVADSGSRIMTGQRTNDQSAEDASLSIARQGWCGCVDGEQACVSVSKAVEPAAMALADQAVRRCHSKVAGGSVRWVDPDPIDDPAIPDVGPVNP